MDETILEESQRSDEVGTHESGPAWREHLTQAAEQSTERMERWIVEQRRRVADGIDTVLIDIEQRRQAELASLGSWREAQREQMAAELDAARERMAAELDAARERMYAELAEERDRQHAAMLDELKAFEEQLGLRLQEQEERLASWWAEAETMAAERFAALGLEGTGRQS